MDWEYYPQFQNCPRCGTKAYETFKTHDCCYECNYSSVFDYRKNNICVPKWAIDAVDELEEDDTADSSTDSSLDDAEVA